MIVLSSLMIHVERFTPAILLPPRMATQRNRHSCPFLCVEFFIGKTRYCMERGCFKSWVLLKHPRELKIKSLYSNDLISSITFKSKQAVQKLKFSDSSECNSFQNSYFVQALYILSTTLEDEFDEMPNSCTDRRSVVSSSIELAVQTRSTEMCRDVHFCALPFLAALVEPPQLCCRGVKNDLMRVPMDRLSLDLLIK